MKNTLRLILLFGMVAIFTGCEEKGPMEKAGEAVDETVEETTDAVKDATN